MGHLRATGLLLCLGAAGSLAAAGFDGPRAAGFDGPRQRLNAETAALAKETAVETGTGSGYQAAVLARTDRASLHHRDRRTLGATGRRAT